jgi:hypothetical protein
LQLCYFIYLEAKDTWAVPIRAQRDCSRIDCFAEAFGTVGELVAHACPTATRIVYGCGAGTWGDTDCPTGGVCRSALGRKEGGIDEEE